MENPLSLYTGENQDKINRKVTRKFRIAWRDFVEVVKQLQTEYEDAGMSDTASRDKQVDWIQKHAIDVW